MTNFLKLCIVIGCLTGCASAQSSQDVARSVDPLGAKVLAAVEAGEDLSELGIFHRYYSHDAARIGTLKGCEPNVLPGAGSYAMHIDWVCPKTNRNAFTRIYLSDGQLSRFEFQPSLSTMVPTQKARGLTELPTAEAVNTQFEEAVKRGRDPTLDGLIPIRRDQLDQLTLMKGWDVFRRNVAGEYGAEIRWLDSRERPRDGADTTIHFNQAGMPIGLWLRTSAIRSETTTERLR